MQWRSNNLRVSAVYRVLALDLGVLPVDFVERSLQAHGADTAAGVVRSRAARVHEISSSRSVVLAIPLMRILYRIPLHQIL